MAFERSLTILGAVALIAACSARSDAGEEKPKPALPSQIEAATFGQKSADPGERLFGRECAFCHVGRNTGTIMLQRRLPEDVPAQLHQRTDLSADYVTAVVRNGLINMPAFSRAELTDAELAQIAAYLAKDKSK
ncbi:c-type cytochrome [Altererythrobacter sp. CC-YST694]|uniref:c-type cytochrome n=1 Tax=Altererythrobacter sp. CC-YST694 TaxID=2755038 RepID=UPI001D026762|nr:cytochrome c [Altererythrobacter sp. CC-YST694]MCB5423629.1 c-type cytochrome [Altererythrobacter sp. CC-YST694]